MNERIKELAEQAKEHANHLESIGVDASMEDIFNQKFAELIAKDCCQFNYDFLESYREASEVNSKIRTHFGVEE